MKKLAEEWLTFAEKDLLTIEKLLDETELTNIVALHSHQCVEKSFKEIIAVKTGSIPKIHNLLRLYGTVRNHISIQIDIQILEEINETYIDARYPSDLGLMPYGSISSAKVKDFFEESKSIQDQIRKIIREM